VPSRRPADAGVTKPKGRAMLAVPVTADIVRLAGTSVRSNDVAPLALALSLSDPHVGRGAVSVTCGSWLSARARLRGSEGQSWKRLARTSHRRGRQTTTTQEHGMKWTGHEHGHEGWTRVHGTLTDTPARNARVSARLPAPRGTGGCDRVLQVPQHVLQCCVRRIAGERRGEARGTVTEERHRSHDG
jgi:hypothetical protein